MDHDVIVTSLSVLKGINKSIRRCEYNDENYFMVGFVMVHFMAYDNNIIMAVAKITYRTIYHCIR